MPISKTKEESKQPSSPKSSSTSPSAKAKEKTPLMRKKAAEHRAMFAANDDNYSGAMAA